MRFPRASVTFCAGAVLGFLACSILGWGMARKNIYRRFYRLNPYLEQETFYYPTASQLIAIARAQCPRSSGKTLVIIGGNSVFNGSGQKGEELWSRLLEKELGNHYQVVNLSAPGAGVVDNGGVIFEALAREYPEAVFVTNTEPGYYKAANRSAYAYLFWDAYYKGLLPLEAKSVANNAAGKITTDEVEMRMGYWLNSCFYYDDLWTGVAYRYVSTIWTSALRSQSFKPRRDLPDWYNKRPPTQANESGFQKLMPGRLESMRRRLPFVAERFERDGNGRWAQTAGSVRVEKGAIADLLPTSLHTRTLIVLTPYNPWFLERLTGEERERGAASFRKAVGMLTEEGYHVLSTWDAGYVSTDFGDTVHMSPAGGRRTAVLVAQAILAMDTRPPSPALN